VILCQVLILILMEAFLINSILLFYLLKVFLLLAFVRVFCFYYLLLHTFLFMIIMKIVDPALHAVCLDYQVVGFNTDKELRMMNLCSDFC